MSDLISRQTAIDAFERFIHELGIKDEPYNYGEMALSAQNVPSVENKGEWRHYEGMLYCPKCGAEFYDEIMEYTGDEVPKHCPDCGADMRGKQDGDK